MTILVNKDGFVAVAIDDIARSLIKPGETIMVIARMTEDGGSHVQVRIDDGNLSHHFWVPRGRVAKVACV